MKNNYSIAERNRIVEENLHWIDRIIRRNTGLMRAAHIVMDRLTRDPELRHTQAGVPVASFSIACDRDFKDKTSGERITDFIDIVAWRAIGEFVSKYFTKGRMAVVSGRLQIRDWTDKEGGKRRSAEIVAEDVYFGDSKSRKTRSPRPAPAGL